VTKINDFRSIKANRFLSIGIEANSPDRDLDGPLWALNWFNRKRQTNPIYSSSSYCDVVRDCQRYFT